VAEGTGPMKPGNLTSVMAKVLNPADYPKDEDFLVNQSVSDRDAFYFNGGT